MSDWPVVCLGEYTSLVTGFPFASSNYTDDCQGIRLLRGDNIAQGRLRWENVKLWPGDDIAAYQDYLLSPDDVVLAMDRPWIEAGLKFATIGQGDTPCLLVQRVACLRARTGLDQGFLRYVIGTRTFTDHVRSVQTGTAVPHISGAQIREHRFFLPPLPEQRAIAEVLGALDDKIEANRRLVDLCDATWRATLAGEEDVYARRLTDLATFVNGRAFTKDATGNGRMVVRIAELNSGPGGSTVYNDIDVPDEHLARPGDLLFSWSGSLTVARWFRPEAIINQHIFKVIPSSETPVWLVHAGILELLNFFRGIAADKATTMGHIQRHHLDEQVLVPKPDRVRELDLWCGPLWQRALATERECLTLASLRDMLLPKLLSGELRVRGAETLVSEAV